ncbi:hypothetical protein HAX54_045594 [Datura stramonium]|uniref:Uncharacterized protein n=1 Tax=Datura stramonium TaxID=4076 RepID=A0ABS8WI46_DATST|nr:hypothetical protein [Datura stramonium]
MISAIVHLKNRGKDDEERLRMLIDLQHDEQYAAVRRKQKQELTKVHGNTTMRRGAQHSKIHHNGRRDMSFVIFGGNPGQGISIRDDSDVNVLSFCNANCCSCLETRRFLKGHVEESQGLIQGMLALLNKRIAEYAMKI